MAGQSHSFHDAIAAIQSSAVTIKLAVNIMNVTCIDDL